MFGKKNTPEAPVEKKPFVVVRAFYGMANHLAKNDGSLPLCGYRNGVYTDSFLTKIDIIDRIPNQHDGWYYCPECAEKATGFDAESIAAYRN